MVNIPLFIGLKIHPNGGCLGFLPSTVFPVFGGQFCPISSIPLLFFPGREKNRPRLKENTKEYKAWFSRIRSWADGEPGQKKTYTLKTLKKGPVALSNTNPTLSPSYWRVWKNIFQKAFRCFLGVLDKNSCWHDVLPRIPAWSLHDLSFRCGLPKNWK